MVMSSQVPRGSTTWRYDDRDGGNQEMFMSSKELIEEITHGRDKKKGN